MILPKCNSLRFFIDANTLSGRVVIWLFIKYRWVSSESPKNASFSTLLILLLNKIKDSSFPRFWNDRLGILVILLNLKLRLTSSGRLSKVCGAIDVISLFFKSMLVSFVLDSNVVAGNDWILLFEIVTKVRSSRWLKANGGMAWKLFSWRKGLWIF